MRVLPVLFALFLLPVPGLAQGISGYTETRGFIFLERTPEGDSPFAAWGTLYVKAEEKLGSAQLTGSVRLEDASSSEVEALDFDPADRRARRPPLSVRELWTRVPVARSIDLQLGRFELGWGKTDGYSPADAFLPRDLSDPFADEKLPLWAGRVSAQRGALRSELVLCPVTTPWRIPELGSRSAPLETASPLGRIDYRDEETPPPRPGFGALRVLATFGDWDVGSWVRYGVRPAPLLRFRTDDATLTPTGIRVPVERRYARESAVGVEASRVLGPWIVRGEAAALFSNEPELGDAQIGTVSLERAFGDGTLLVTLAGNFARTPSDPRLLFDRGILPALITVWNRSETWGSWKVVWTAALRRGDGLVKAELGYDITEVWKVTLGADVPYGSEEGTLGALHAAKRVRAAVRRAW